MIKTIGIIFLLLIIILLITSCRNEVKKESQAMLVLAQYTDTLKCCQNLAQDTLTYQPFLNTETMSWMSGYFDGFANTQPIVGFAKCHRDSNEIFFSLPNFDKEAKKVKGVLVFGGKYKPNQVLSQQDFTISYNYHLGGACFATNYEIDTTKKAIYFLKHSALSTKNRINGCLSAILWKKDDKQTKKYHIPDSIVFNNIKFSALVE